MGKLTNKRKAFIAAYLTSFNATQAAREAGYSLRSADVEGTRLLVDDRVQAAISTELDNRVATVPELLARLSEIARGGIAEYVAADGSVDIPRMVADGKGYLIEEVSTHVSPKGSVTTTVKLADRLAAIDKLLRAHGAYRDNSGQKTINVHLHGPDVRHREWALEDAQAATARLPEEAALEATQGVPAALGTWSVDVSAAGQLSDRDNGETEE